MESINNILEVLNVCLNLASFLLFFYKVDNTALHVTAEKGHYQVLWLLLQKIAEKPGLICQQNKVQHVPFNQVCFWMRWDLDS